MKNIILIISVLLLFSNKTLASSISLETIKEREEQISSEERDMPNSMDELLNLRLSLKQEMEIYKKYIKSNDDFSEVESVLSDAQNSLVKTLSVFSSGLDCNLLTSSQNESLNGLKKLREQLNTLLKRDGLRDGITFWMRAPHTGIWDNDTGMLVCERWKIFLQNKEVVNGLEIELNTIKNNLSVEEGTIQQVKVASEGLNKKINEYLIKVDGKIQEKSKKEALSGNLWVALLVIGAFSIATMLVVKLFSPQIQLEWVASGQVIQFVTVMILLSVVMALGLAEVLKETTLGTLLGGLAGYVLAQGVGRAAAREASRSQLPTSPEQK